MKSAIPDASSVVLYYCSAHSGMGGKIIIKNRDTAEALNLTVALAEEAAEAAIKIKL